MPTSIVPAIYDPSVHQGTVRVKTESAYAMARQLARQEGLLVGQSSGAAVLAALAVARGLDEGVIVAVGPDGGDRYLSTALWNDPAEQRPADLLPGVMRIAGADSAEDMTVVTRISASDAPGIILSEEQIAGMVAQARRELPHECCGLLAGVAGRVERVFLGTNVDHSPFTYYMEPKEVLKATMEIEAAGQELLAIYHSHTHTPAYPSATDVAKAHYPDSLYLIISLKDPALPEVRGFRITGGDVTEASVIVR
jgi:proteasome lid subunit RPN8/RPN11